MAKFTLTIKTDNAAFDDDNREQEIARILREAANRIENDVSETSETLRDFNGNKVGAWWKHDD